MTITVKEISQKWSSRYIASRFPLQSTAKASKINGHYKLNLTEEMEIVKPFYLSFWIYD